MSSTFRQQIKLVIFMEILIVSVAGSAAYIFWKKVCAGEVIACLSREEISSFGLLLLSFFRPLLFTPTVVISLMAGNRFNPILAAFFSSLCAVFSCSFIYLFAKVLGKKLVTPWIQRNLPQTFRFMRSQDWKVVLASRLIPFLPFDLMTFFFGLWDFRWKKMVIFTFLGTLPENYLFAYFAQSHSGLLDSVTLTISWFCLFFLIPGMIIEFLSRKKGSGMWVRLMAMLREIKSEFRNSNEIIKRRHIHTPGKTPVLLLYGFFSSRRSLSAIERYLNHQGYEVFSFNLGGLFGVFFTRSIVETAQFIDYKIQRQMQRNDLKEIRIVAHSKGGFVALWWLLKLGGASYCKTLITLGTPFRGSPLTWLALITPVGFVFKDILQMKPGSKFLKDLHDSEIPEGLTIYNFHSESDKVSKGLFGIFHPKKSKEGSIIPVPMNDISHFGYLKSKKVVNKVVEILKLP